MSAAEAKSRRTSHALVDVQELQERRESSASTANLLPAAHSFGQYFEERSASPLQFHEKPVSTVEALAGVGKAADASKPGIIAPQTGDSEALKGWRNVHVLVPMYAILVTLMQDLNADETYRDVFGLACQAQSSS